MHTCDPHEEQYDSSFHAASVGLMMCKEDAHPNQYLSSSRDEGDHCANAGPAGTMLLASELPFGI